MRVITYVNPKNLAAHPEWQLISGTPHLCATVSLARGMQRCYQDHAAGPGAAISAPIEAINNLFKAMLPAWKSDLAQVRQYSAVTRGLDWLTANRPAWRTRLQAFRRNQREVQRSIRTLAEGGLYPANLPAGTEDEQIFKELWTWLEQNDGVLKTMRADLFGSLETPSVFRQRLQSALDVSGKLTRIVLHGFYFITPLQARMAQLMEKAGIELIYLNCYDERFERIFQTWQAFFPNRAWWEVHGDSAPPAPAAALFAQLYQGRPTARPASIPGVELRRYASASVFLDEIRIQHKRAELPRLFSPRADDLNSILRDFFPERYQRRHFLAYPAGRLLYELHQMWDEASSQLLLTPDGFMECLSSGLLQAAGLQGQAYTLTLRRAFPFVQGCQTRADWTDRLGQLAALLRNEVPKWETTVSPTDQYYTLHRTMNNPFRRLGHTSIEAAGADALLSLASQLFDMADELFRKSEVPIHEHLKRIERLVIAGVDASRLLAAEQDLLAKLKEHLDRSYDDGTTLPRQDLATALQFFLGGVTDEDDEELVGRLDKVDGAPLTGGDERLHLLLLTESALPSRLRTVPWPVTEASLQAIRHLEPARLLLLRQEEAANASLYLFYYTLAFGSHVTLSWVAEWQGEPVEESLYLLMLQNAGLKATTVVFPPDLSSPVPAPAPVTGQPFAWPWAVSRHMAAEFALCRRRFYYSYIAAPGPVAEGAFLHEFLYSAVVARFMANGMKRDRARPLVDPFFPHIGAARKRDVAERYGRFIGEINDTLAGVTYNSVYRRLLIPGIGLRRLKKAVDVFEKDPVYHQTVQAFGNPQTGNMLEASSGDLCRFCPHSAHCADTHFPVDDDRV